MDSLREAEYLRGYAQKNPFTEYTVEGFDIFDKMLDSIRQEIASRVHLVRIQAAENRETRTTTASRVQSTNHSSVTAFGSGAPAPRPGQPGLAQAARNAGPQSASRPDGATVVRTQPKVGRNDPCPCGSGKKYKHCHGR
jgi:preprotein translocase subunit SecA